MSRIGARPITIQDNVIAEVHGRTFKAASGDRVVELEIPAEVTVSITDSIIMVGRVNNSKEARSLHGLTARLINNALVGVKDQFKRELTFSGTGYRAALDNGSLVLNMGYSHEIRMTIPEDLSVSVAKNAITITGVSKEKVGEFAAKVREVRGPEVYKGKGIKYKEEFIKRKAGKTASSK